MSATGWAGTMQGCDGPFGMAGTDFVQGHEVDFPVVSIGQPNRDNNSQYDHQSGT